MDRYHLVGVGGVGMSPLAQILAEDAAKGLPVRVQGSDRSHDRGERPAHFKHLADLGVKLVPQDGSGVKQWLRAVVVSTAIEDGNPDISAARARHIPIIHRSDLLAGFLERGTSVAVTGTSGKSSVTAMLGHILAANWKDPLVIGGAAMLNFKDKLRSGHARHGKGPVIIEADESDGTVVAYYPDIAVITSLSLDHKPVHEVREMFKTLARQTRKALIVPKALAPSLRPYTQARVVTFGIDQGHVRAAAVRQDGPTLRFRIGLTPFEMTTVGRFQVLNAVAATAAALELGLSKNQAAQALKTYAGVDRRFNILGHSHCGATVVDDYAHNPEKLAAAIHAARHLGKRVGLIFQPHGFGPTRMLKDHLKDTFSKNLRRDDGLFLLPIYYAGGTVTRDVSSEDLIPDANPATRQVADNKDHLLDLLRSWTRSGDVLLLTGARDPDLGAFAHKLLDV